MLLEKKLTSCLSSALQALNFESVNEFSFKPTSDEKFGDYQTNAALILGNKKGVNPRKVAEDITSQLTGTIDYANFQIAGPGFINVSLKHDFILKILKDMMVSEKLGCEELEQEGVVVVDYSHPNLAKEMHVGHLRSTIIGDAIAKVLEFVGYTVVRHNHMGDWGTQFGMLIAYLEEIDFQSIDSELSDLEKFYRASKKKFDADKGFADRARLLTVKLQSGDPECLELWKKFIAVSIDHCDKVYHKLDVSLRREHVVPESFYNDDLAQVVSDLDRLGLVLESDGAKCVYLDEFKNDDGEILPVIVQKKDGGYLYSTTDLAAIRYRANKIGAKRLIYVVDSRQSLHLKQVFSVARKAEFLPKNTTLEHFSFGTMMGKDGKPFKTRSGETVKLMDLLSEAEDRAKSLILEKSEIKDRDQIHDLAHVLGIGSVKYADLSKSRKNDYIFNLEEMIKFEGNTAPYLQYAYTRIRGVFKKFEHEDKNIILIPDGAKILTNYERQLSLSLIKFPEVVNLVGENGMPHILCSYLYDLSRVFMVFYEHCPVLTSDSSDIKQFRLALCLISANILEKGLGLLGIGVVEEM